MLRAFLVDSHSGAMASVASPVLIQQARLLAEAARGTEHQRNEFATSDIGGVKCAIRPFDPALVCYAAWANTYHSRAVEAKTEDIAERQWNVEADTPGKQRVAEEWVRRGFGEDGVKSVLGRFWHDFEQVGNAFLEVQPSIRSEQEIAAIAHVPAVDMWVRADRLGYVQSVCGKYSHWRRFGVDPARFDELPPGDPLKTATHRMVHLAKYNTLNPDYGKPPILPAWSALCTFTLIAEFNQRFFENHAVPDYVVLIEGDADPELEQVVKEYLRTHIKRQNGKTLVLMVPNGAKVTFQPVADLRRVRDGSFRELRMQCRDEILHAHNTPPLVIGIVEAGKLGGNLGGEELKMYRDNVVAPGQEKLSEVISRIVRVATGDESVTLRPVPFSIDEREQEAKIDKTYVDMRALEPGEVRAKRFPDLAPLPTDQERVERYLEAL